MLFVALVFVAITLYCLAAIPLKLPSFQAMKAFRKADRHKNGTVKVLLSSLSKTLSRYMPMGMLRQMEMQKRLDAAHLSETPKQYTAESVLHAVPPLVLVIPAYCIHPALALLPVLLAVILYVNHSNDLSRQGDKRRIEIEKELPRFVSYMANTLKSSRNVLDIMDAYRADYQSPLTDELKMTSADMRTGNAERALQKLEARINSPFMSELIRGMLSAMRGDDMTTYFDNLLYELNAVWEQRLDLQTQKKEPKIMRLAYFVFIFCVLMVTVVLIAAIKSASSIFTMGVR